ncbi:mersacidin/lichenicidin family type 2 lantibiotic [Dictyobacter aurantiacus]|uniref:Mersacidin/lichenicidin family type 2 lantibiotic n=1 Tax=Dictyobacter aurantiacus TaxID=1936993 RepID=A0A401ZL07_9CHLR|nr:mersacidin/lichenicidin family type 2 lantibiotic [Dictyobacter aurantiacus]GCE07533.1 hypothetical protein KDAU_48620 [Dictyobacter aurantiacus]
MTIEEIIRAWKTGTSEDPNQHLPGNPIGDELSDNELAEAFGGKNAQDWIAMPNGSHRTKECGDCKKHKKP